MDGESPDVSDAFESPILLSSSEAARLIGVANITLKKSRRSGVLLGRPSPRFMKMGRLIRYEPGEIYSWINQFQRIRKSSENYITGHQV